ncbi:sialoadhesin-like [Pollicipes pollicipes]|uniref:sialoadhesin-like n=1 Tax=Pollicipes pollicipes TaxID=41117 RepID=UPI001884DD3D|nr:sialoadhesin-like [Pollicipes pollicipes]
MVCVSVRPQSVSLAPPAAPLRAKRPTMLTCRVAGSHPEPVVTWWLGAGPLAGAERQSPGAAGNGTTSSVTFTPRVSDQGQTITCRAANPLAGDEVIEDSLALVVQYPPEVTLTQRPERDSVAGGTVQLLCRVRAEPPATRVRWRHDTVWLTESPLGVRPGAEELTLTDVGPHSSGNYTCSATNSLGTTESGAVAVRVQHVPFCESPHERVFEAARGDMLNVTCAVMSHPKPEKYRWSFNSSGSSRPLQELGAGLGNTSVLSYTPRRPADFGLLRCWAQNALGEQQEACSYVIKASDVPDPPASCEVSDRSSSGLRVRCRPGFDGGLPQTFRLEVRGADDLRLHSNVSSASPRLGASDLVSDQEYRLSVFALNRRGSSRASTLVARTLVGEPDSGTGHRTLLDMLQMTPILGVLIGLVAALVLTAVTIVGARRYRTRPRGKESQQGICHVQLVRNLDESGNFEEKQDPDLIPQKTEFLDAEEKHMIERLRNGRFPPPPARFGGPPSPPPTPSGLQETLPRRGRRRPSPPHLRGPVSAAAPAGPHNVSLRQLRRMMRKAVNVA